MRASKRIRRATGVVAAVGGVALFAVTLNPNDNEPTGDSVIAGHGRIEASEGSLNDQGPLGPADQSQRPGAPGAEGAAESTEDASGFANPWAAGSAAAARYLSDLGRECLKAGAGAPASGD